MDWFQEIYEEYSNVLYSLARREIKAKNITYISADDVVQDTFLDLYKARKKVASHPNIGGWLVVTLRHNLSALVRKKNQMPGSLEAISEKNPVFSVDSASAENDRNKVIDEDMLKIQTAIGAVDLELLNKRYIDGMSLAELAREEKKSEDAMKMKIYRLRMRIKEIVIKN